MIVYHSHKVVTTNNSSQQRTKIHCITPTVFSKPHMWTRFARLKFVTITNQVESRDAYLQEYIHHFVAVAVGIQVSIELKIKV